MTTLFFIVIFVTFTPFLIAQVVPNRKWLLAYFLFFSTATMSILYAILQDMDRTVASGKDLPGHGFGEALVLMLIYIFSVSGISGIISKAIFLHLKSRAAVLSQEFIFTVSILTIVLTFIIPISMLKGWMYMEQHQRLEKIQQLQIQKNKINLDR